MHCLRFWIHQVRSAKRREKNSAAIFLQKSNRTHDAERAEKNPICREVVNFLRKHGILNRDAVNRYGLKPGFPYFRHCIPQAEA